MTREEAIEKIKSTPLMRMPNEHGELREALEMAIVALDMADQLQLDAISKQIPKKPRIEREYTRCASCGGSIPPSPIFTHYCRWCGQKINWGET